MRDTNGSKGWSGRQKWGGDISEAWRQWLSACSPPPPSTHSPIPITWIFARICHNSSSCHCAGCLSFSTPAACENCSSDRMVPWHPLNTWMNAGSAGDLCFLVLFTSDLFFKVRPTLPLILFYYIYIYYIFVNFLSWTHNHMYCSEWGGKHLLLTSE